MGPHHGWMDGMGGFMFPGLGLILIIILVIVIVWLLLGQRTPGGRTHSRESEPPATETPLEILRRRYANGEITREEFESMKEDLKS